jgi:hypothetical protein
MLLFHLPPLGCPPGINCQHGSSGTVMERTRGVYLVAANRSQITPLNVIPAQAGISHRDYVVNHFDTRPVVGLSG